MAEEKNFDKKFQKKIDLFKKELGDALGNTVRKPAPYRLGTVDSTGNKIVKVPEDAADEPNEYYFSEVGSTSFRGKAQIRANAIPSNAVRYGTPIRVIRDVLTNRYEIIGVDTQFFEQYFKDSPIEEATVYDYKNLAPGMIRATNPVSMQVVILPASYNLASEWKLLGPLFSVDWSQDPYDDNIPTTSSFQRYVLIVMDFENETLLYTYGDESDVEFTFLDLVALDIENGNNNYIPMPEDTKHFRAGYIRLYNGQTAITNQTDIIQLQDYLAKGGGGSEAVTSGGEVLVSNGSIVTAGV